MSSKNICVYISDYGYGHASRDIAQIRRVLRDTDAHVCVRAGTAAGFMENSLSGVPILRSWNDVGVSMTDGTDDCIRRWV